MKKKLLIVIAAFILAGMVLASCGQSNSGNNIIENSGRILVGTRKFKMVSVQQNYWNVTLVVPEDSAVSILPETVNQPKGKGRMNVVTIK